MDKHERDAFVKQYLVGDDGYEEMIIQFTMARLLRFLAALQTKNLLNPIVLRDAASICSMEASRQAHIAIEERKNAAAR